MFKINKITKDFIKEREFILSNIHSCNKYEEYLSLMSWIKDLHKKQRINSIIFKELMDKNKTIMEFKFGKDVLSIK